MDYEKNNPDKKEDEEAEKGGEETALQVKDTEITKKGEQTTEDIQCKICNLYFAKPEVGIRNLVYCYISCHLAAAS